MANEVVIVVNPDTASQWEIPLGEGETILGRDPELPFAVQHSSVSSRHAAFHLQSGRVRIQDLGSTNGSFVEGSKVESAELTAGQRFQLGEVLMKLVVRGAEAAAGSGSMMESPRTTSLRVSIPKPATAVPAAESAPAGSEGAGMAVVPTGVVQCRYHAKSAASYFCRKCDKSYCGLCVTARGAAHHCRACGEACVELEGPGFLEPEVEQTFYQRLPEVFAYPFRGNGVWLIILGGLLFGAVQFLMQYSWYITIAYVGFLVLYAQQIIQTSAQGMSKGPEWPDFSGGFLSTLLPAFLQYVAILLICLGPGLGLLGYGLVKTRSSFDADQFNAELARMEQTNRVASADSNGADAAGPAGTPSPAGETPGLPAEAKSTEAPAPTREELEKMGLDVGGAAQGGVFILAGVVLACLGALYMPMAMLSVAMFDSVSGVSPTVVVPSIFRVFLPYVVIVGLLGICLGVWIGLGALLNEWVGVPGLNGLIAGIPGLYLLTTAVYSLGMMYHTNRERLGWF